MSSLRSVVASLIARKPWVLPILYHIYSLGEVEYRELREILGLRSPILKRGIWWLVKYGVVERIDDKIRVSKDYRSVLDSLFLNRCIHRNNYVFRIGETYVILSVKKTKVSVYTLPAGILEKLYNKIDDNVDAKKLSIETNLPIRLVQRAIRTYRLLKECKA